MTPLLLPSNVLICHHVVQYVTLLDYFYTYHTQTNTGTASFLYLDPLTKAMSLIIVLLHRDPCYLYTI